MIDFYLYRTKLAMHAPGQQRLFTPDLPRSDLLLKALNEKPSLELRKGHTWHIGNVRQTDDHGGYFAVGRTTKSIIEKYDEDSGDFVEEDLETSPYTHVLYDSRIGVLAIAKKSRLAPTVQGIARKTAALVESTDTLSHREISVSLDPISDPHSFIESLQSAYSIRSFEVTFSRSNPFDADRFFQKPMEKYLDAANGETGKTSISGEDLDPETLVDLTKSVAATGNNARARLRSAETAKLAQKSLRGNPAHFQITEEQFEERLPIGEARETYQMVRGRNDVL